MGNFYIVEAGGNGFAARKQKKNLSQGSKADKALQHKEPLKNMNL